MLNQNDKRPGRPSLQPGHKSVHVRTTFPPDLYDRMCRESICEGVPISAIHRKAVRKYYGDDDDDD